MLSRFGILFNTTLTRLAESFKKRLGMKVSSLDRKVSNLSGGNQQKVVLGKVLARGSKIVVFAEPTRGIHVGTRPEVYSLNGRVCERRSQHSGKFFGRGNFLRPVIGLSRCIGKVHRRI